METTDQNNIREIALEWWDSLIPQQKSDFTGKHFTGRRHTSLTGREIQLMCEFEKFNISFIDVNMKDKLRDLAQNYLGMTPKDKGCVHWSEMQDKMVDEMFVIIPDQRELLIDFYNFTIEKVKDYEGTEANWIGVMITDYIKTIE